MTFYSLLVEKKQLRPSLGGYHFLRKGGPKILGVINFWKEKYEGHKICDDQNVGSHKMTTDSVYILFKKIDFDTILACLGVRCMGDGGHKCCCRNRRSRRLLVNLGLPLLKKMIDKKLSELYIFPKLR